jgi:hypothetical protein
MLRSFPFHEGSFSASHNHYNKKERETYVEELSSSWIIHQITYASLGMAPPLPPTTRPSARPHPRPYQPSRRRHPCIFLPCFSGHASILIDLVRGSAPFVGFVFTPFQVVTTLLPGFGVMVSPFNWDDRGRLLACNLDCTACVSFQHSFLKRFGSSVHHAYSSLSRSFLLLSFCLSMKDVSLALHSMLGGALAGFHVVEESNRHFWFSVASIKVGFMVLVVKRAIAESFACVGEVVGWPPRPRGGGGGARGEGCVRASAMVAAADRRGGGGGKGCYRGV